MKPAYSLPKINKKNPKLWYIEFHYDVPVQLWNKYPRKRIRFKKYDNINRHSGVDREKYAEQLRQMYEYSLTVLHYNPFQEHLQTLTEIQEKTAQVESKIEEFKQLTEEQWRKLTPISKALDLFITSREERIKNGNSISTYKGTVKWLKSYFESINSLDKPIGKVTRLQIANAIKAAKAEKEWGDTTYNKQINFAMTIFNWLANEDFMEKNPANGRIDKIQTKKNKHRWYDRTTAKRVKDALLSTSELSVYRACQFTYMICIRSKAELMKLRIEDIDRDLKRVRFRSDLSKSGREEYRDYPIEFETVLDEMKLDQYPVNYYVFGRNGEPSDKNCHKDFLAVRFKPIKEKLKLSDDYTLYGWKHTRVVHEMMKGADPYKIQHMCRHSDLQTTMEYMRDFDISLVNVYGEEDLRF